MGDRRDFAPYSLPTGIVVVHGEARLLVGGRSIQRFGLDGPIGDPLVLPPVGGDRDWDSSIAAIGEDIAVVTQRAGGLDLRLVSRPDDVDRVEPAGLFVHLGATARRFVACSDWLDTCGLAWANRDASWISTATEYTAGACPIAWVPDSGPATRSTATRPTSRPTTRRSI
jgi:hypothetical protein